VLASWLTLTTGTFYSDVDAVRSALRAVGRIRLISDETEQTSAFAQVSVQL
jgi:hypothetical protein